MKSYVTAIVASIVLGLIGCAEPSVTSKNPDGDGPDLKDVPLRKPESASPAQAKKIADKKMEELKAKKGKSDAKSGSKSKSDKTKDGDKAAKQPANDSKSDADKKSKSQPKGSDDKTGDDKKRPRQKVDSDK